jgi:hypothetical protein
MLTQDRCIVCVEHTIGSEIILDTPDGTPRWGHVGFHFGPFENGVSVGARKVHCLCRMYHRFGNHFGRTRWNA